MAKIGYHARAIAFAKWSVWVNKHSKNETTLELLWKKNKKHPILRAV